MKVAITGASGMIGSALKDVLEDREVEVLSVTRSPKKEGDIFWDIKKGEIDSDPLNGIDCVVHLAGEPIFGLRWTEEKKKAIRSSRIDSTALLVKTFRELDEPPKGFVCGSAVGIYGDCGDEEVDESEPAGKGFLAEVCQEWEEEAKKATAIGMRVVHARTGLVLSSSGGLLEVMKKPFSLGFGGKLGCGKQGMSWISLRDEVEALAMMVADTSMKGPYNLVSPSPVSNEVFSESLADALGRSCWATVPEFAINLGLGEMGKELMLTSTYAIPRRLSDAGYIFKDVVLRELLEKLLVE